MRRALALVVLAAGAAAIVAVVSGGQGATAQAAVQHAAARSLDAVSSRFTITLSYATSGDSSPVHRIVGRGIMDYRRHKGSLAYEPDLLGGDEIYDGDVVYFRFGDPEGWFPKDKPWLRSTGEQDDPFDPAARAVRDPSTLLHFLRLTSSEVHEIGTDSIDGVQTTHYEGILDLQKIVDEAPADQRAELQEELDFIKEDEPTRIRYELWADASGVTRRLRLGSPSGEGPSDTGAATIDFFDYGVAVDVQPPPADQILSDEEFMQIMQQHATDPSCSDADTGSGEGSFDVQHTDTLQQADKAGSGGGKVVLCLGTATATSDGGNK